MIGQHLINGVWRSSTHARFARPNPTNWHQTVGTIPTATPAEVDETIAAARKAFPAWKRTSRIHRAECFDRLAGLLQQNLDPLAKLMATEIGKPISECRAELIEGLHMVQYVFGTGRGAIGECYASEIADKDISVMRKPWGVAAIITPWNFPVAVPLWMLGPTLVEGNVAIWKPSEDSPAVGQCLAELFVEAGFPAGVVQLLHGKAEVGEQLVDSPEVNLVLFTGSSEVGNRIRERSAHHVERNVAAEMGGKSAVIVMPDARLDLAVSATILSAFKTSGQRCVSAGRVLVAESLYTPFAAQLVATAQRITIGSPHDPSTFMGPLIHPEAVDRVLQYRQLAIDEGANVLLDGQRLTDGALADGWFVGPFIYRMEHRADARCLREEVFGPHLAIIPFRDLDDAIRIYNDTEYGLSLAVITEDYRVMRRVRDECDFGMGYVNLPCIGAEVHLPFGGVKRSGNGHPSAAGLVDAVTHRVTWTINHGETIRMAQGLSTSVDGTSSG